MSRRADVRHTNAPVSGTINTYRCIEATDFIKEQDAVPAIQLGHAGRKASCHTATEDWRPLEDKDAADGMPPWQGLAPSALDQLPRRFIPKAMDQDDIRTVLDAWREATRRSMDAGYDILNPRCPRLLDPSVPVARQQSSQRRLWRRSRGRMGSPWRLPKSSAMLGHRTSRCSSGSPPSMAKAVSELGGHGGAIEGIEGPRY